jgi:hypothetical protein
MKESLDNEIDSRYAVLKARELPQSAPLQMLDSTRCGAAGNGTVGGATVRLWQVLSVPEQLNSFYDRQSAPQCWLK